MSQNGRGAIPEGASWPVDVYKGGRLAAHMWRVEDTVVFRYRDDYVDGGHQPIAFTLPLSRQPIENPRLQAPPFFAGLLPEGESRRRAIQRAFHLADDDELGLLAVVGADTVGDVQVVPEGESPPDDDVTIEPPGWGSVSFRELWEDLPGLRSRSGLPGVQPKMSAHSRSLHGGAVGAVILKFPVDGWHGVLSNERFFMSRAVDVGLPAPEVEIVSDREGQRALQVARFDRTFVEGTVVRHAQEDASQVLGLRPGQKYDPDARTVIGALASLCASPKLASRDLFHQLAYSYVIGNNDVHAKNLSIRKDPESGLWTVSPIYDVLHTWPYEGDHQFFPPVRTDGPHDTITLKHWLKLAADIDLAERAARRILERVVEAVAGLIPQARDKIEFSSGQMRDLSRVVRKRARDIQG